MDLILYGIVAVTPSAPVTVFGLASVQSRGHALDAILFAMIAMVLTAISYGRMAALYPSAGSAYTDVLQATSFAALTYIGFDSITTLAEDAYNPKRNVLLATVIVCLFTRIFGGSLTYLAQLVWPDFRTFPGIATAFLDVARRVGGGWLFHSTVLLLAVAIIGAGLTGQVGAARVLFAMGRDNVLPKMIFAHLFLPQEGHRRSFRKDLIVPGLGFVICLAIWLGLGKVTKIVGCVGFAIGLIFSAIWTRGFRMKPVMLNLTESG